MTSKEALSRLFLERTGKNLYTDRPLAELSNFRIGGPADLFFEAANTEELRLAVRAAAEAGVPFYVIGGGYNVLFSDAGYRGLIIKNSGQSVREGRGRLVAGAGTSLATLLQTALARNLRGLEFLAGIPGTVGGAIFGNAGAFGGCIGDRLDEALVLEIAEGQREAAVGRDGLGFGYRHSRLKETRALVLEAAFRAEPGERKESEALIRDYLERRKAKHPPWGTACAGSYFKNPCLPDGRRVAAGELLEKAGAKGLAVGGASVYEGHANFIINRGGATAADVLALAAELKKRVLDRFGVSLEEEVIHVREDASML
jgi:UDP-N-acetylmuramate dehydrogenase